MGIGAYQAREYVRFARRIRRSASSARARVRPSVLGCRCARQPNPDSPSPTPDRRGRLRAADAAQVVLRRLRGVAGQHCGGGHRTHAPLRDRPWCCRTWDCHRTPTASPRVSRRCSEILQLAPRTKIIVVTGSADRDNAVRAVATRRLGFLFQARRHRGAQAHRRARVLHRHARSGRTAGCATPHPSSAFEGIIAHRCRHAESLSRRRRRWRPPTPRCCILGESGTGKELVARAIHGRSERREHRVRRHQLRGHPGTTAGERAVRLREGRIHRRGQDRRRARSRPRRVARCSSTRSATCRWRCRPNCCASCRTASSSASAAGRKSRSTCAWSAPPTRTWRRCITAQRFRQDLYLPHQRSVTLTLPPLRERPGDAVVLAQAILRAGRAAAATARAQGFHAKRRWSPCSGTTGRATCASSRTRYAPRSSWPPGR